jgi:hypothetical protein
MPNSRRKRPRVPGQMRAQKNRPVNAIGSCRTDRRTKRRRTRAPICSILRRRGASRQGRGDRLHR